MFYWRYRDKHLLLTDKEESDLVRMLASPEVVKIAQYDLFETTRREMETKIFAYLRALARNDPELFERNYHQRSLVGSEAARYLPQLIATFGRITGIARLRPRPSLREAVDALGRIPDFEIATDERTVCDLEFRCSGLLLRPRRWVRLRFDLSTLEWITGTVTCFSVAAGSLYMSFTPRAVEISVRGNVAWLS